MGSKDFCLPHSRPESQLSRSRPEVLEDRITCGTSVSEDLYRLLKLKLLLGLAALICVLKDLLQNLGLPVGLQAYRKTPQALDRGHNGDIGSVANRFLREP